MVDVIPRVLQTAHNYIGTLEGSEKHKQLVALYNSQQNLPRGYVLKETDAWCAAFITALGVQMHISHILLPECSVGQMVKRYQKVGRFVKNDPQPGDLVIYDWGEDGRPDHIGLVSFRYGRDMTVIEGNYKDRVAYRELKTDDGRILGYCRPNYEALEGEIKSVKAVQQWLNVTYFTGLKVDGIFGKKTAAALLKALQFALGVEEEMFGEQTRQAVRNNNLRLWSRGELTEILQAWLLCRGYPLTVDGIFGKHTQKQLIAFQKKEGLAPDGIAGSKTFEKFVM